jgi:hypothetical protein
MPWGIIPILKGESIQDRAGSTRRPRERTVLEGIFWVYLALARLIAWGFSEDAGSGDPAYNWQVDGAKVSFFGFCRSPAWQPNPGLELGRFADRSGGRRRIFFGQNGQILAFLRFVRRVADPPQYCYG